MPLQIRKVTEDEFPSWLTVTSTAFFSELPSAEYTAFRREHSDLDRSWGAFDGEQPVATLRTFPCELTLPGGAVVAADAVTSVTTLSTHRRQGALTAMMTASLEEATERGDVVSILIAARWPIYGRYGYGPATETTAFKIGTHNVVLPGAPVGSLAFTDGASARVVAEPVYDAYRRGQLGGIKRRAWIFDMDFGLVELKGHDLWKGYCVVHRDLDGRPDGYLRYHVDDTWHGFEPDCTLIVDDLIATTPAAYADLWRLCLTTDNVTTVTAADRSVDEPLRWLLNDGRAVKTEERSDFLWVRVLDVPSALSARRYLVEGRLVVEVDDPLGTTSGRYALDGGPGGATCARTEVSPDLTMTASALGAALLGGTRLGPRAGSGAVVEHTHGALATADAMFLAETTPWCNTTF